MAIIRTASLIGAISGQLGGSTFAHAKAGPYVRSARRGARPTTQAQSVQQSVFANVVRAWSILSAEQRRQWNRFASLQQRRNRLGISKAYSGYTLFLEHNSFIFAHRGAIQEDSPLTPRTNPIESFSATIGVFTPYQYTFLPAGPPADTLICLYASRPVSVRPRTTFHFWRLILAKIDPDPVQVFTNEFNEILGPPQEDELIGLRMVQQTTTRLRAFPFQLQTTVT